jgi:hypothetical protein
MPVAIPKLAEGKAKGLHKRESVVAINTPEVKSIVQKKNNRKKASWLTKLLFIKEKGKILILVMTKLKNTV